MTDPRLGSRSPTSTPSSPTSIHSSSSAIFERDVEPLSPPSPPTHSGDNHNHNHTHTPPPPPAEPTPHPPRQRHRGPRTVRQQSSAPSETPPTRARTSRTRSPSSLPRLCLHRRLLYSIRLVVVRGGAAGLPVRAALGVGAPARWG
ncbi:hypothetical protein GALMADRAFT_245905 [Galerina marginata CBS 339.88]|uniref:Uncharacterized protein n=1 Tax=Galerina marginata (strain CBS 339.88) TaxID=685588 RepID=A0A067TFP2_GALM3|nr:hypothetical protein GALMADRAFT_245905 [Galerina marginata CBS 339.88]